MSEIDDLLQRLQAAATEGSRELDARIEMAAYGCVIQARRYTGDSLAPANTLLPEGANWEMGFLGPDHSEVISGKRRPYIVSVYLKGSSKGYWGEGNTPALALSIGALKARAAAAAKEMAGNNG